MSITSDIYAANAKMQKTRWIIQLQKILNNDKISDTEKIKRIIEYVDEIKEFEFSE